jgi:hypothetical protein
VVLTDAPHYQVATGAAMPFTSPRLRGEAG